MEKETGRGQSLIKWGQDPGWRGLIGFISPPAISIDPTEFLRIAPEGFQVVQTMPNITYVPGWKWSAKQKAEANKELENSCLALKKAGVDVIALSGTPFAFVGGGYSFGKETCDRLEKVAGIPVVMMGTALVNALKKFNYRSVAVACTYYTDEMAAGYTTFLKGAGIKVLAMENWVSQGIFASQEAVVAVRRPRLTYKGVPIGIVYQAGRIAAKHCPDADCIVLSGGGVSTMDIIQALEEDVKKPVISSLTAQIWEIFVRLGVSPVIRGRGSLLASFSGD